MSAILIPTAAIIVSIVLAIVQYAQWRTANEKVVIDLSERRLKVYQQLAKAINLVVREGECSGTTFNEFMSGLADATFLFGEDVQEYLQTLRECLVWLVSMTNEVIDKSPNRAEMVATKNKHLTEIIAFHQKAPGLFAPYMKLTQKNTPFWRPWS